MNPNENNLNNENVSEQSQQDRPSMGSRLSSFAHTAQNFRNNGGIRGAAQNYVNDKKDQLKDNIKGKINDKIPDSVKQKQEALKNGINAPKNVINNAKDKIEKAKGDLNEKAFRKGVSSAANAIAPGTGVAAEKMLDTGEGKKAIDAAREADNPVSAVKKGNEKLIQVTVTKETKKKLLIALISTLVFVFIIMLIALLFFNKFADGRSYANGGVGGTEFSKIDEKYTAFYENVDKYSSGADKLMIVAVLTAYADNDDYTDMEAEDDKDDGDGNTEISEEVNGITTYSKSKMKKYIKKVAKKIKNSGSIEKGDYNDTTTGSEFFWWLYDDFVVDYYGKYVTIENDKKRQEIVNFIYMYYEELKQSNAFACASSSTLCSSVIVEGVGSISLEEYVAGVVKQEMGSYYDKPEVMKAFAIAARSFFIASGKCGSTVSNSENYQTYAAVDPNNSIDQKYIEAANSTAGMIVLKADQTVLQTSYVTVPVSKYRSYNDQTGMWTYTMLHDASDSNSTYTYTMSDADVKRIAASAGGVYYPSDSSGHHWGMLSYAAVYEEEQGKKYDEILKVFYGDNITITASTSNCNGISGNQIRLGNDGIFANSIFPIDNGDSDLYLSAGYSGYYRSDGTAHGAVDIACYAGGTNCYKYNIIASHPGVVTYVSKGNCNSHSLYSANKVGIPYNSSCEGNAIIIKSSDGYQFYYWHLSSIADGIEVGQEIAIGQYLGQMGNTGNSSGSHLHFSIIDPSGNRLEFDDEITSILGG